tara:strand:+ start:45453 stop:46370 length:918 start_codon:yes stop_codon:yes gene_type:complete
MESTKNDKQNPTTLDGHSAQCAGLSSAMHDIRMLAARYEAERQTPDAGDSLHLAGVTMQPQHILQPKLPSESSERWKVPAFLLVMVLGLSTSAFALSLYAEPESLVEPTYFHTDSIRLPAVESPLPTQLPSEQPLHESLSDDAVPVAVVSSPVSAGGSPSSTGRASVTPKIAKARPTQKSTRSEVAPTCDEVACLVDSSDACCSQYEGVAQEDSVLADYKPYRPDRSDAMRTIRGVEADVLQCFDEHGETGLASVDFVIQTDGSVREVELSQGALGFRACVREQMRTLSFEPLQSPFKMSFPFRK